MATRTACTTIRGQCDIDRQTPGAIRHRITNVGRVVAGMGGMTGAAGAAFASVDVQEVQVLIAIPEFCQGGCLCGFSNGVLMTHKAELVVVRIVGGVEAAGKILPEHPEVGGAMRVMTAGAVTLSDRAVVV